jgi:regulator of protease activity HflC (stomatin/prohibitin superfamily)
MDALIWLLVILAGFSFVTVIKSFVIVRQSEVVIIERLGTFNRDLKAGFQFVIPFIEQPRGMYWVFNGMTEATNRIDIRESVLDVPEQAVITRDNVSIHIDAIMYVQITDPIKATYEIQNLPLAVAQLAQTSLRNVIGEMDLDETLASRDIINTKLKQVLDDATEKWGLKVNRVELKNISPPREIQTAMEKQMQAERERRAKVLVAEGDKQARIAQSEGLKQEQINIADGDKEGQVRRADGEAQAILKVAEAKRKALEEVKAAIGSPDLAARYLIAGEYLHEFGKFVAQKGDKVFIPYEASTALGSIGSIKELISGEKKSI